MKACRGSTGVAPLTLKLSKQNQHLNDNHAFIKNAIFDTIQTRKQKQNKNLCK